MELTKEQKEYAKMRGYSEEKMKLLLGRIYSETGVISGGERRGKSLAEFMKRTDSKVEILINTE